MTKRRTQLVSVVVAVTLLGLAHGASPARVLGPPQLAGFSVSGFSPDTYGTLTTTFTVPAYSHCPARGGDLSTPAAEIRVQTTSGRFAEVEVYPFCQKGKVRQIYAMAERSYRMYTFEKSLYPASGDVIKATVSDDGPKAGKGGQGSVVAVLQDLTTGKQELVEELIPPSPLAELIIGQTSVTDIAAFSPVQFTNTFFKGNPFGTTPGLRRSVMTNDGGKPMIQVTGPSPDGKAFTTIFRRTGKFPTT